MMEYGLRGLKRGCVTEDVLRIEDDVCAGLEARPELKIRGLKIGTLKTWMASQKIAFPFSCARRHSVTKTAYSSHQQTSLRDGDEVRPVQRAPQHS